MNDKPRPPICATIAELRRSLGYTQQSFANHMGWSISSAVRFENVSAPGFKAACQLFNLARDSKRDKAAAELRAHLLNHIAGPHYALLLELLESAKE